MKKTKKLFTGIFALVVALFCCFALASCGGNKYVISHNKLADFAADTYHAGYMSAVLGENATYTVTLELSGGNYTLTKEVKADPAAQSDKGDYNMKFHFVFAFNGSYETNEDGTIKLSVPTECVWEEDWAGLNDYGAYVSGKGTATSASDTTENGDIVFNLFSGEFLNLGVCSEQTVTLNENTFVYED